jgi:hypothetical protein
MSSSFGATIERAPARMPLSARHDDHGTVGLTAARPKDHRLIPSMRTTGECDDWPTSAATQRRLRGTLLLHSLLYRTDAGQGACTLAAS